MQPKQPLTKLVSILLILSALGCNKQASIDNASSSKASSTQARQESPTVKGHAAWYGPGYYGSKTTSGEILKEGTMTAAHSSLPMGTKVRVTRLDSNKTITVMINDRKPFKQGTVIDLAHGSATALNVHEDGKAPVEIEVIEMPEAANQTN